MTYSPLMTAPPEIQIHIGAALVALILGPLVIYRRRRDRLHKVLGYVWITSMATLAVSALFIGNFRGEVHFGILHVFSVITLAALFLGICHAIRGNIAAHEATFRSLYRSGLLVAGMFTFLPGRRFNRSLFGDTPEIGYGVIAMLGALLIWRMTRDIRRPSASA